MCLGSTAILLCEPTELAGALLAAPKPQLERDIPAVRILAL